MNVEQRVVSDAVIVRYLLGELSAEEQDALERRYFGDSELLDRIEAVEDDLIDDYVGDALTPLQRRHFERHFLTEERRERVRMAEALQHAAPPRASRRWWAMPLAATLFVAALLTVVWMALRQRPAAPATPVVVQAQPRSEPVPQPKPQAEPPAPSPPALQLATITLFPGLTRGDDTPVVSLAQKTDAVRLEVLLEAEAPRYEATLHSMDGAEVWKGSALVAMKGKLLLTIPRERLRHGEHLLTVTASNHIADYAFEVR
jgi:hypothetical protein